MDLPYHKTAVYSIKSDTTATSITVRRNFLLGEIMFPAAEFPELRAFYNKLESKDQEPVVLKVATQSASQ